MNFVIAAANLKANIYGVKGMSMGCYSICFVSRNDVHFNTFGVRSVNHVARAHLDHTE